MNILHHFKFMSLSCFCSENHVNPTITEQMPDPTLIKKCNSVIYIAGKTRSYPFWFNVCNNFLDQKWSLVSTFKISYWYGVMLSYDFPTNMAKLFQLRNTFLWIIWALYPHSYAFFSFMVCSRYAGICRRFKPISCLWLLYCQVGW